MKTLVIYILMFHFHFPLKYREACLKAIWMAVLLSYETKQAWEQIDAKIF